jgi:hypothetical protein
MVNILNPRKALNKAFLKVKASRSEVNTFKENLIYLLDNINESESEEFHKKLISRFLEKTYYENTHFVNTKGRNDLVIHNGISATNTVGVIIEAKKPTNKGEMMTVQNINSKAFQELVLYYLRERITHKNLEVKQLIATNIYEWYIFDAHVFEKEFAQNKTLVKQFIDFEEGRSGGYKTDFFYNEIAAPAIEAIKHEITFTHFDIRNYEKPLRNTDVKDDNVLIALFKLLSPEHLLKLPFANDSNSLDKTFYTELLHIIGLVETKEGGKKLIKRKIEGQRNAGSLIEGAIFQLDSLDKISRLDRPMQYGENYQERLFNVALELSITWINRILFLKLLEAQLLKYHKGDKQYSFLNMEKIQNFDDLNNLFFSVLARRPSERNGKVKALFNHVPYLNSSLFEPTEVEHTCLFISQLKDDKLPLLSTSVIKDNTGKKRTGEMIAVDYLFEFLNAYDFASEGSEEIQEDNKKLINASVLGLIFEKINGYKDGSIFTPGFITMYMCRETIRRAVIQKFNDVKGWNCKTISDLYNKIEDRVEANAIINSLKLCDPAVGSGHFLVSALNEMIAIKSELRILIDRDNKRLKEYNVIVENDELIVTDEDGKLFEYNPKSPESQRIQETLFHEKQTIIENCLFGVDLNPNSVKICRLRLWIELLKNTYYKGPDYAELETLPNIDINIKCGNSIISRYALDTDIKKALKGSKWTIDSYRLAVMTYRNAQSKDEKRAMEKLITEIKNDFESEIASNDKRIIKLSKARGELLTLTTQTSLFDQTKKEKADWNKAVTLLTDTIAKFETELKEIRNNKIYENAFEWRFEFPEILNDEGDFVGFDVVIGNPPYGAKLERKEVYKVMFPSTSIGQIDTYKYFVEFGFRILKVDGFINFITSDSYLEKELFADLRCLIVSNSTSITNIKLGDGVFLDVNLPTAIFQSKKGFEKNKQFRYFDFTYENVKESIVQINDDSFVCEIPDFTKSFNIKHTIIRTSKTKPLLDLYHQVMGVKVYQIGKGKPKQTALEIKNNTFVSEEKLDDNYYPYISQGIKRYYYQNKNEFIKYGEWLAEPREIKYFKGEKIVLREIINPTIFATYFDYDCVVKNIAAVIIPKKNDFSLKYLLGLINSKLMTYYVFEQTPKSSNKSYPSFNSKLLKEIPIYLAEVTEQQAIANLATQILYLKNEDPSADTTALESEIDQLVYQLYGLTEEEIRIVEGK